MYLYSSLSILKIVRHLHGLSRKLALLSHENKSLAVLVCQRCSKYKSSGLCSGDDIVIYSLQQLVHLIDGQLHALRILCYTCHIPEYDSRLWKIRNTLDILFYLTHLTSSCMIYITNALNSILIKVSLYSLVIGLHLHLERTSSHIFIDGRIVCDIYHYGVRLTI